PFLLESRRLAARSAGRLQRPFLPLSSWRRQGFAECTGLATRAPQGSPISPPEAASFPAGSQQRRPAAAGLRNIEIAGTIPRNIIVCMSRRGTLSRRWAERLFLAASHTEFVEYGYALRPHGRVRCHARYARCLLYHSHRVTGAPCLCRWENRSRE